ncbi:hypothetical protein BJF92_03660 [Rhizobium rhizosphaerae]|uniref:Glycosyl transferase n=1 Tax=Xaviernesmea rhizosphaerae TaxID=1672749 RepID=A0A1Q9AH05_9HYPH|nr:hypothetical protein [Xaviernesmea rhizosphaerae]OLP54513.1 hypothetical protein BJF92_03660 [Xaviernesmea rhizosphaerae]
MLTVILQNRDAEAGLAYTLAGLVPGAVEGLVSDVMVLDQGSRDQSRAVADAAGARFLEVWTLQQALAEARGSWVLFLEAGARPMGRWIEDVAEHMALRGGTARFTRSRLHRRNLLDRLLRRGSPLALGLLLPIATARAEARDETPEAFAARLSARRSLACELVPAGILKD